MIAPDFVPQLKMQKAGALCENIAGAMEAQPSIWEHLHPLDLTGTTLGLVRALPVFYSFLECQIPSRTVQSTSSSIVVNKMSFLAPAASLLCCVRGMTKSFSAFGLPVCVHPITHLGGTLQ